MKAYTIMRIAAFAASVYSLSLFFAGFRQVMQTGQGGDWALLAGGTALTLGLLGLQGYWIYFEEKAKGSLKKQVRLFECVHDRIQARDRPDDQQASASNTVQVVEKGVKEQ